MFKVCVKCKGLFFQVPLNYLALLCLCSLCWGVKPFYFLVPLMSYLLLFIMIRKCHYQALILIVQTKLFLSVSWLATFSMGKWFRISVHVFKRAMETISRLRLGLFLSSLDWSEVRNSFFHLRQNPLAQWYILSTITVWLSK